MPERPSADQHMVPTLFSTYPDGPYVHLASSLWFLLHLPLSSSCSSTVRSVGTPAPQVRPSFRRGSPRSGRRSERNAGADIPRALKLSLSYRYLSGDHGEQAVGQSHRTNRVEDVGKELKKEFKCYIYPSSNCENLNGFSVFSTCHRILAS